MTADLILAIDQGTTSTRALVFDAQGNITSLAQRELKLFTPENGWVEQDPEMIWTDTLAVCHEALAKSDIKRIAGIGITNQRETTVVWDRKSGKPVYNAIVWQDRRTAEICKKLNAKKVRNATGLLCDPYFSGTKVRWILDNVPGARDKAHAGDLAFGTIDSFLLWRLTNGNVHATDATNASRTLLFNIHKQQWDKDLLKMLDIPASMLPDVRDSASEFGITDAFGTSLSIRAILGDQQAALFGQACFTPGMVKSTYGTGCFALMNTGSKAVQSKNRLLTTVAWRLNGKTTYAIEGSIFVAGAAVQFLRDSLKLIPAAQDSEKLANSVPNSDGVVFVPALTGLGAPYWDPHARGAIFGLTRGTTPAHIVRATLEAQAYQTRDLMEAMAKDSGLNPATLRVDGGLARNDLVCSLIASQLNCVVERPQVTETTAWGAAALAGLQAGLFKDQASLANLWRSEAQFTPAEKSYRDENYAQWKNAIRRVMT